MGSNGKCHKWLERKIIEKKSMSFIIRSWVTFRKALWDEKLIGEELKVANTNSSSKKVLSKERAVVVTRLMGRLTGILYIVLCFVLFRNSIKYLGHYIAHSGLLSLWESQVHWAQGSQVWSLAPGHYLQAEPDFRTSPRKTQVLKIPQDLCQK